MAREIKPFPVPEKRRVWDGGNRKERIVCRSLVIGFVTGGLRLSA